MANYKHLDGLLQYGIAITDTGVEEQAADLAKRAQQAFDNNAPNLKIDKNALTKQLKDLQKEMNHLQQIQKQGIEKTLKSLAADIIQMTDKALEQGDNLSQATMKKLAEYKSLGGRVGNDDDMLLAAVQQYNSKYGDKAYGNIKPLDINKQMSETANQIKQVEDQLTALGVDITTIEKSFDKVDNVATMDKLSRNVSEIRSELNKIHSATVNSETSQEDINKQLEKTKQKLQSVKQEYDAIATDVETIDNIGVHASSKSGYNRLFGDNFRPSDNALKVMENIGSNSTYGMLGGGWFFGDNIKDVQQFVDVQHNNTDNLYSTFNLDKLNMLRIDKPNVAEAYEQFMIELNTRIARDLQQPIDDGFANDGLKTNKELFDMYLDNFQGAVLDFDEFMELINQISTKVKKAIDTQDQSVSNIADQFLMAHGYDGVNFNALHDQFYASSEYGSSIINPQAIKDQLKTFDSFDAVSKYMDSLPKPDALTESQVQTSKMLKDIVQLNALAQSLSKMLGQQPTGLKETVEQTVKAVENLHDTQSKDDSQKLTKQVEEQAQALEQAGQKVEEYKQEIKELNDEVKESKSLDNDAKQQTQKISQQVDELKEKNQQLEEEIKLKKESKAVDEAVNKENVSVLAKQKQADEAQRGKYANRFKNPQIAANYIPNENGQLSFLGGVRKQVFAEEKLKDTVQETTGELEGQLTIVDLLAESQNKVVEKQKEVSKAQKEVVKEQEKAQATDSKKDEFAKQLQQAMKQQQAVKETTQAVEKATEAVKELNTETQKTGDSLQLMRLQKDIMEYYKLTDQLAKHTLYLKETFSDFSAFRTIDVDASKFQKRLSSLKGMLANINDQWKVYINSDGKKGRNGNGVSSGAAAKDLLGLVVLYKKMGGSLDDLTQKQRKAIETNLETFYNAEKARIVNNHAYEEEADKIEQVNKALYKQLGLKKDAIIKKYAKTGMDEAKISNLLSAYNFETNSNKPLGEAVDIIGRISGIIKDVKPTVQQIAETEKKITEEKKEQVVEQKQLENLENNTKATVEKTAEVEKEIVQEKKAEKAQTAQPKVAVQTPVIEQKVATQEQKQEQELKATTQATNQSLEAEHQVLTQLNDALGQVGVSKTNVSEKEELLASKTKEATIELLNELKALEKVNTALKQTVDLNNAKNVVQNTQQQPVVSDVETDESEVVSQSNDARAKLLASIDKYSEKNVDSLTEMDFWIQQNATDSKTFAQSLREIKANVEKATDIDDVARLEAQFVELQKSASHFARDLKAQDKSEQSFIKIGKAVRDLNVQLEQYERYQLDILRQNDEINYAQIAPQVDAQIAQIEEQRKALNQGWKSGEKEELRAKMIHDQARNYVESLEKIKTALRSATSIEDVKRLEQEFKLLKKDANELNGSLAAQTNVTNNLQKLEQWAERNHKAMQYVASDFNKIYQGVRGSKTKDELNSWLVQFNKLNLEMARANLLGSTFTDKVINKAIYQSATLLGQWFSLYDAFNLFRRGIGVVQELNTAMTELNKVSNESATAVKNYMSDAIQTAQELGATVKDTIEATSDWARLGYGLADAQELAKVALLYKNVSDGMDISSVNESLISTIQGFKLETEDAIEVVDKFNNVANNFAISTGGIGEALKRSAASFNSAHTDLSKSIALVTTTNEVVQDADSVGTMWKTVAMRIRGAKAELEEAGEDTEGMVETTSQLRDIVKGMTGFDIMADEDTYKDVYDIIVGIGKEWDKLTDIEQASLLEKLAGKRMGNALSAALNNVDRLQEIYATAENSDNSALIEQQKYMQSIQYSFDRLTASSQAYWNTMLDTDLIKGTADSLNTLLIGFTKLTEVFGGMPTIAGLFGGAMGVVQKGLFKVKRSEDDLTKHSIFFGDKKLSFSIENIKNSFTAVGQGFSQTYKEIRKTNQPLNAFGKTIQQNIPSAMKNASLGIQTFVAEMKNLGVTTQLASLALNTLVGVGIGLVFTGASVVIDKIIHAQDDLREKAEAAADTFKASQHEIDSLNQELETTQQRLEELNKLDHLTLVEQEEYNRLIKTNEELEKQLKIHEQLAKIQQQEAYRQANNYLGTNTTLTYTPIVPTKIGATQNQQRKANTPLSKANTVLDKLAQEQTKLKQLNDELEQMGDASAQQISKKQADIRKAEQNIQSLQTKFSNYAVQWDSLEIDPNGKAAQEINRLTTRFETLTGTLDEANAEEVTKAFDTLASASKTAIIDEASVSDSLGAFDTFLSDTYPELRKALKDSDIKLEEFVEHLNSIKSSVPNQQLDTLAESLTKVDVLSSGLDKLKTIFDDIQNGEEFNFSSLIDEDFVNTFGHYTDEYNEFIKVVSSNPTNIEACKTAFNNLTTAWLNGSDALDKLDESNKDVIISMLKSQGIANADQVVAKALIKQKINLAMRNFDYSKSIDEQINAMSAELKSYGMLEDGIIQLKTTMIKMQELMTQAAKSGALARIKATSQELQAIKSVADAQALWNQKAHNFAPDGSADYMRKWRESQDAILQAGQIAEEMQAIIDSVNKIDYKYSSPSSSSSKDSSSSTDAWKEAFEKAYKEIQHLRNMDLISTEEYMRRLDALNKYYFANRAKYIDEYRQYLEEVYHLGQTLYEEDAALSERYINNRNTYNDWKYDSEVQAIERMKVKLENSYRQGYISYKYYADKKNDYDQRIHNAKLKQIQSEKDALDNLYDMVKSLVEQQYEDEINAIEKEVDAYNDLIEARKKELQLIKEKEDYNRSYAEAQKAVGKIEKQLQAIENDDSASANAKRLELYEQLEKAKLDVDDLVRQHQYESNIQALEDEQELYKKQRQKEIDALEEESKSAYKIWKKTIDKIDNEWDTLYDELRKWNREYGTGIDQDVTKSWDKASEALNKYKKLLGSSKFTDIQDFVNKGAENELGNLSNGEYANKTTNPTALKVLANGKSPSNAKVGDYIVTGGGVYQITGGSAGNWQKSLDQELTNLVGTTKDYNQLDSFVSKVQKRINQRGYATGGINTDTGLAMMHGSNKNAEVIFNSKDARKLWEFVNASKDLTKDLFGNVIKNIATPTKQMNNGINTSLTFNVEGNLDKTVVPDIEKIIDQTVAQLNKSIMSKGISRNSKTYAF